MPEVTKILLVLAIFTVVSMVIGFINEYRTHGKLNAKVRLMEILRASGNFLGALVGRDVPKMFIDSEDSTFGVLDMEETISAMTETCRIMRESGWKDSDYIPVGRDCGEFAMKKNITFKDIIISRDPERWRGKAVPAFIVGYASGDGESGHQFNRVDIGGEVFYFNCYSSEKWEMPWIVSRERLARMNLRFQ